MKIEEIIDEVKKYFGKDRKLLKEKILSFNFNGSEYKKWQKQFKQLTEQPLNINYLMFDDVIEWLKEGEISEIDWNWLGDLSWKIDILLNEDVGKGFDWDKKLCAKCGGTAKILRIYASDVLPFFVYDTFYMTYHKKENYYEFGPISKLSVEEKRLSARVRKFFENQNYKLLDRKTALTEHQDLTSDCNSDGNATLFDSLFCDTSNYQTEIIRFNDLELTDSTGRKINWNESYRKNGKLIKREEYRYFSSKNVQCTVTDEFDRIIKVKIWRDIGRKKHREFILDILEEFKESKKKEVKK